MAAPQSSGARKVQHHGMAWCSIGPLFCYPRAAHGAARVVTLFALLPQSRVIALRADNPGGWAYFGALATGIARRYSASLGDMRIRAVPGIGAPTRTRTACCASTRLAALLWGVLEISDDADQRRKADLDQARRALARAETAIRNLLMMVEDGIMSSKYPDFAARLAERRNEKARLIVNIDGLGRLLAKGSQRVTPDAVERFGKLMAQKLRSGEPALRNAYVRLLVGKVNVMGGEVRIFGSKAALEHAALDRNLNSGRAPSFDREWCTTRDRAGHYNYWEISPAPGRSAQRGAVA